MHAVPAGPQRQLVRAQHARVEEAEQLDLSEGALAEGAELLGAVLLHVPGVVGLLGPGRRERQQVGRRDVRRPARAQHVAEVAEHRLRLLHVLDRLEEHDRVARLRVALHQVAHEADAGPRVLEASVLVGLRVGVHAGHVAGAPGEHVHPVALSAGHVDDVAARAALGDPLVHRQVAAEPVVLGGHVGERALAGQLERRHALGLGSLDRVLHGPPESRYYPPAGPCRAAERIRDANVRYHDLAAEHYDSKWGINYSERRPGPGDRQAAQGAGPRAGAATSAPSRSAPAPATSRSTCCAPAWSARRWPPTSRPACSSRLERSAGRAGPGGRDRGVRGGGAAVRGRLVRPRVRPRGAPPPARPDGRLRRVPPRAAAGRRGGVLRRAVPLRRPARRVAEARRERRGAAVAGAHAARGRGRRANGHGHDGWSEEDRLEQVVDVHAFTPGQLSASRARRPASRTSG